MKLFVVAILTIFLSIIVIIIASVIITLPVMLLWNWLMPIIFGLTEITILQAFGLTLLCYLLFKPTSSNKNGN